MNLKGLGKVLSDTYYVTQVIVRLSPSGMTQQITVHKDTLGVTEKADNEKKDTDDRTRETVNTKETKPGTYIEE